MDTLDLHINLGSLELKTGFEPMSTQYECVTLPIELFQHKTFMKLVFYMYNRNTATLPVKTVIIVLTHCFYLKTGEKPNPSRTVFPLRA